MWSSRRVIWCHFWILFILSLISGLHDGSIVIWNPLETDEAKQKRVLPREQRDPVQSLSFSPDGRFLASIYVHELIIRSTEVRNWMLVSKWLLFVLYFPVLQAIGYLLEIRGIWLTYCWTLFIRTWVNYVTFFRFVRIIFNLDLDAHFHLFKCLFPFRSR